MVASEEWQSRAAATSRNHALLREEFWVAIEICCAVESEGEGQKL